MSQCLSLVVLLVAVVLAVVAVAVVDVVVVDVVVVASKVFLGCHRDLRGVSPRAPQGAKQEHLDILANVLGGVTSTIGT